MRHRLPARGYPGGETGEDRRNSGVVTLSNTTICSFGRVLEPSQSSPKVQLTYKAQRLLFWTAFASLPPLQLVYAR